MSEAIKVQPTRIELSAALIIGEGPDVRGSAFIEVRTVGSSLLDANSMRIDGRTVAGSLALRAIRDAIATLAPSDILERIAP